VTLASLHVMPIADLLTRMTRLMFFTIEEIMQTETRFLLCVGVQPLNVTCRHYISDLYTPFYAWGFPLVFNFFHGFFVWKFFLKCLICCRKLFLICYLCLYL